MAQYSQITGSDNTRIHAGDNYISSSGPQIILLNGDTQDSKILLENLQRVSAQLQHLSPGALQEGFGNQAPAANGQKQPTMWERLAGAVGNYLDAKATSRYGTQTVVGANSSQTQSSTPTITPQPATLATPYYGGYAIPQVQVRPMLVMLGSLPGIGPDHRDTYLFDATTKRMQMWFHLLNQPRQSFFSWKTDFYLAVSCSHSQLIQGMVIQCANLKKNVATLPYSFQWPGAPVYGTTIHVLVFLKRGWTFIGEGSYGQDVVEGRHLVGHYTTGITFSFPYGGIPTSNGYFARCTQACCAGA